MRGEGLERRGGFELREEERVSRREIREGGGKERCGEREGGEKEGEERRHQRQNNQADDGKEEEIQENSREYHPCEKEKRQST